ncbi:MAG: perlucin-like protein [Myxococcales bacterium]|nr:perlucin-like protein [Myxococcales bacterium]
MRAHLMLVLATSCAYAPGLTGDAAKSRDAGSDVSATRDAQPIDAPKLWMDASSTCIAHASDTSAGHHYFVTGVKTRDNAASECASFEGHLVKLESEPENTFVTAVIPSSGTGYGWIGLHHDASQNLVWADGSPLSGYNAFSGGVPPSTATDCFDSNGVWSAYGCANTNHGVCECE